MASKQNITDIASERAVQAWTRRNSGRWTEADETELQKWLAAAPEHLAAYEKVTRVWAALGAVEPHIAGASPAAPPDRRHLLRMAAACVVAAAVGLGVVGYKWWNGAPTTWTTRRGETRTIVLADGSQIVLDAGSEVESRIGAHVRHVVLRQGEALITVVHDTSRPFAVDIGRGRITDLGTRFDVETIHGQARVAVLEGRVDVNTSRGKVVLEAGRAGGYDRDGDLLPIQDVDGSVASWRNGQRHFNSDRLADVLERLERYHAVTFHLTDPHLRELQVSGTFRTGDLSLFLRTLQAALPIEARWMDPKHIEIGPRTGVRPRG